MLQNQTLVIFHTAKKETACTFPFCKTTTITRITQALKDCGIERCGCMLKKTEKWQKDPKHINVVFL